MTAPLFPTWTMPTTVQQTAQTTPPPFYGAGFAFDFDAGDFVLDEGGHVLTVPGDEAWGVWVVKAVTTQRLAYPVYDANYGCDLQVLQYVDRSLVETQIARSITEAVLADPRSRSVSNIAFDWTQGGDALGISFTAAPTIGSARQFSVRLTFP